MPEPRPAPEPERYELAAPPAYAFAVERRHFLQLTGGGLLIAVLQARSSGQAPGGSAAGSDDVDDVAAWLRVGADDSVTVFTGKVEIGQNTRTSLAQAVADELRVPFERVTMVMGDTARTPFDNGTFGSQTTPRMAPRLAQAARAARALLLERAAAAWQVDVATLSADDGRISARDGHTASYGEMVRDQQLHGAVPAEAAPTLRSDWRERGTARAKTDARAFVTGGHRFTPDIVRPGMLHGKVVRPERLGATAITVDLSGARSIEGVVAVHDDTFIGVAAATPRAAAAAAGAVRVSWQTPATSVSSDTLYDALRGPAAGSAAGRSPTPSLIGDIAEGRRLAARTFARTFRIPYIAHVPLEPRAAVAEWADDGSVTVWTGTQRPFGVRRELAQAFKLQESQVRVIVPDTGSAYGGKHTGEQAIEAARLARAARRPVSLVWTRAEEFMWAYARPAGVIEAAAGVDADGRLVAWTFDNWNSGTAGIRTPYDIPHQAVTFHPVESPLRQGSYRALAATANTFAREMVMDEIARALGRDLLAFRLQHLSEPRLRAVVQAVADHVGWPARAPEGRAWGLACGTEKNSVVATAAEVERTADGFRVTRLVTAFECGAIVNPDGLKHQVEGAIVQGLGGALFEALRFADGRLQNGSLAQYRVPRFGDVPALDVLLVDRPERSSDGAGETPIIGVAPAIGSAARGLGAVADELPVRLSG